MDEDDALHPRWMFSAEVSWRHEAGINRAYVWLSDGSVAGYRDLDTGIDHPASEEHPPLLDHVLADWLVSYGLPCAGVPSEPSPPAPRPGSGPGRWFASRKAKRQYTRAMAAFHEWRLDHPTWRVPTDPPHGGWRDLVRNEPGDALWAHASQLPPPRWFELSAKRELRAWTTGAAGEADVAAELWRAARPGAWRYVHSVPVGTRGSDIDHVLVGPCGVFTINTKAHRGANIWVGGNTFMVNGQRYPYLRNARHEAARASRLLSRATGLPLVVRPLIVVVDPRSVTLKNAPSDVTVVTRRQLRRWLSRLSPIYTPERVDVVFHHVRRSTTWS